MKEDYIHFLSRTYPHWWSQALKSMPNGHYNLLVSLFHQCDLIAADHGDTSPWVTLHFERLDDQGGLFRAYAAPLVVFEKWTDGSAIALIIALQFFNECQKVICEVCGLPEVDFASRRNFASWGMVIMSIDDLRAEYPQWWHPVLEDFPHGWTVILAELFRDLDGLNSPVSQQKIWVSVHFEQSEIGPWTVYVSPAVRMKDWFAEDALHALTAVEKINFAMSHTCEICGSFIGSPRLEPTPARILCEEHRNAD